MDATRSDLASCRQQHPSSWSNIGVGLADAALASAAIPVAFPPVKLADENYVDGGVREVLPIQVAVETELDSNTHARADQVYAIVASATGVPAPSRLAGGQLRSFDGANVLDIANRVSVEIMPDETLLNETDPPSGWGQSVTIIQPEWDIHDILTVDPGLVSIRMAHGYMRADDVLQAKAADPVRYRDLANAYSTRRLTTAIISLRRDIWELEYAANGRKLGKTVAEEQFLPSGRDPEALTAVRQMKRDLSLLVAQRGAAPLNGALPPNVEVWWMNWERHKWAPSIALWDADTPFMDIAVAVEPKPILFGRSTRVVITVTEAGTGRAVPGQITITTAYRRNPPIVAVFAANTPFTHTFRLGMRSEFDPGTNSWINEQTEPSAVFVASDTTPGKYPQRTVPFEFA